MEEFLRESEAVGTAARISELHASVPEPGDRSKRKYGLQSKPFSHTYSKERTTLPKCWRRVEMP